MKDDRHLWASFKAGDRQALSAIFHQHIRILYKYGSKFSKDGQLVEDCIQDLFMDLWQKRQRLGDTDSIKRYLLGALRRRIIRQDQRGKKYLTDAVELDDYDFEVEFTCEELLIAGEIDEERHQQLQQALQKLSKRQKEAIYLKFYAEMDYQQVAEIMNLNYQSVRNLIHNALKKLRGMMLLLLLVLGWLQVAGCR
ncbi:MAG: sigma-70 family RNA polymerase sigma factor [Bacteroidetes bacterium]|nr:MAG: sigma-70 family RNA polymerase sigma factor [Bacteroidota bacterium]